MTTADLAAFRARILTPGLAHLEALGGPRVTLPAERFLLAIALQESALRHRYQVLSGGAAGPARGWWQFEAGGGVAGVMRHPATAALARALCEQAWVAWDPSAIWRALEGHDGLAVGFARLLVWSDPAPLPETEQDAWDALAALVREFGAELARSRPPHWGSPDHGRH